MADTWLIIDDARVVDGSGAPARAGESIVVRGDRIVAVGPDPAVDIPRGDSVRRIAAGGKTVMPGLVDVHCHLSFGESRSQEEQDLYTSVELRTLRSAWNAQKILRAGVTSISQPGGSYFIGVGLREGIKDGIVTGPRMTTAGRYLTTSNGLTDYYPDAVGVPESSTGVLTNTDDEMKTEVRHQIKNGVDFIKLADSPFGDYQAFTTDEMCRVTELAHQLKRKVTIHARGPAEVEAAVAAEMDWIMHGNVMTDRGIEKLADSGIPLVPTLLLLANWADYGGLVGVADRLRDGSKRMLEKTAATLHKAYEAGVTFAVGTDTGFAVTPYGEWHARELELLMTYTGMSSLEAITAGTRNCAAMLDLDGRLGEVKAGYLADLLIVDGNPDEDIKVLQDRKRIDTVVLGGQVVAFPDEEPRSRPFERSQILSAGDLTYDLVHGAGPGDGDASWPQLTTVETRDLASSLAAREARAAGPELPRE